MTFVRAHLRWIAGALILCLISSAWLVHAELQRARREFETQAGIVHRVLSLRAVEHEAILATLALLDTPATAEAAHRLPAIYPRIVTVLRTERTQAWAHGTLGMALSRAEASSRSAGRAWGLVSGMEQGRLWLVLAGEAASHALEIDLAGLVTDAEWPFAIDAPGGSISCTAGIAGASIRAPTRPGDGVSVSTVHSTSAVSPSMSWRSAVSGGTNCRGRRCWRATPCSSD